MEISVDSERSDGTVLIKLAGELDFYTAPSLRAVMQDGGIPHGAVVLLDLSDLTLIDSTGLGVIIGAQKRIRRGNGRLEVYCPRPAVYRIFTVTALHRVLTVHAYGVKDGHEFRHRH